MMKDHFLPYQVLCLPVVPEQDCYVLICGIGVPWHDPDGFRALTIGNGVLDCGITFTRLVKKMPEYRDNTLTDG